MTNALSYRSGMIGQVNIEELVRTWEAVAATSSRLRKTEAIAAVLARLPEDEVVPGVAYLSGELRQRQIGVGWAALRELPPPAAETGLQIGDVDAAFEQIGQERGAGSAGRRKKALQQLFGRATDREQAFLRQLIAGELRQGAQRGVMTEAVARASGVPVAGVRRALLVRGDLRAVAAAALSGGAEALAGFGLVPGHALSPMLAASAENVAAALERISPAALEWKLDGVRIQVHRDADLVRIFTRSLDDITARLPEVVAAARALPVRSAVLDGEVIALRPDGRPRPFQVTAGRVGAQGEDAAAVALSAVFFDLLHLDGTDFLDRPEQERFEALAGLVPAELLVPRLVTADPAAAEEFFADAVRRGHEGVVVKALDAPYDAGRRGSGWLKVKPRHTLDLVILAVEWGHGRRKGLLSNLHLGARDPDGGFVMLGKTFKGLTDAMLAWQTERLQELAVDSGDWVITVRPELVAEIAFDGVQRSSRYPGGLALRFARVKGYRVDKSAAEADTIQTVREIYRMSGGEP